MKKIHLFSRMVLVGSVFLASIALFAPVSSALTISPPIFELNGDPGTSIYREIELLNEEEETKTFFVSFENFEAQDDSGAPNFIGAEDGLATWLSSDVSSISLQNQQEGSVAIQIDIPADATPGGYFAAVFFSGTPPSDGGGVGVSGRVGSLILLRVTGDVEIESGVTDFDTVKSWFSSLPAQFEYVLSNGGGSHVKPSGEIVVTNMFRSEVARMDANPVSGNVLPGSERRFSVDWHAEDANLDPGESSEDDMEGGRSFFGEVRYQLQDFRIGFYTASLELVVSDEEVRESVTFLIFPWQSILVLVVIVGGIWKLLRLYREEIIREVRASGGSRKKRSKKRRR